MKLSRKLFLLFLLITVLPLTALGFFYLDHFERALIAMQSSKLSQIADKKIDQIDSFLNTEHAITLQLSQSLIVTETLKTCCSTADITASANLRSNQKLLAYYRRYIENFDIYDVLLIDSHGNIVFSAKQEGDQGININAPALRDTSLAASHQLAIATLSSQLSEFRPYPSSNNAPAAFVVAPVFDEGSLLGTVAVQLRSEKFREVSTDRTGLGISGETIMATLNSQQQTVLYTMPMRHIGDAAYRYRVPVENIAEPMRQALLGNFGAGMTTDYANRPVLATWRFLPQLRWGMVVKIDAEEALQPLHKLRYLWLIFLAGVIVLISSIAWIFGRNLVFRLQHLARITRHIADGNLKKYLAPMGDDEIGQLALAFNDMLNRLQRRTTQLEQVRALNQSILDNASVAIISTDPNGIITSFNRHAEQTLGYRSEEMIGLQTPQILHVAEEIEECAKQLRKQFGLTVPPDFETFIALSQRNLANIQEWHYRHKDGSQLPVLLSISTLRNQQGEITGYLGIASDLTEQKKNETALREQAMHTQAILDNVVDSIITIDAQGLINSFNRASEKMFGYHTTEVIGKNIKILMPEPYSSAHDGYIRHFLDSGQAHIIGIGRELKGLRKDGDIFAIELAISQIRLDNKLLFIGIIRDITERKQTEHQLLSAKEAAEAANQAKSDFVSNMSHEIRTPLNGVIGLTQLLQETSLDNKQRDYLEKIQKSSKLLLDILNDILDYSKIEAGRLRMEAIDFELDEVFHNAINLFAVAAEQKNIELTFDIAEGIPEYVNGDPLRLGQILNNLLSNALKFTEQGEIHVKVESLRKNEHHWLRIAVRDTGIGINPEQLSLLFQAFTQADSSTTRKYGGTGLGLTICKRLVNIMGGEIGVESQPSLGSNFYFEIPLQAAIYPHNSRNPGNLQTMRALIIDSRTNSSQILERLLTSWRFSISKVHSGADALQTVTLAMASNNPFELLLIDWQLPDMDGFELSSRIDQLVTQHRSGRLPLMILLASHTQFTTLKTNGKPQLDAVLYKPFIASDLFDTLINLQSNGGLASQQQIANHYQSLSLPLAMHGRRILLVEDNHTNQIVACGLLEKMKFNVDIAENGMDALQKIGQFDYDAILMDLHMPQMGGLEAAQTIRASERGRHIPIIAMTAAAMQEDRDASLAAGMNDHIAKPINDQQLAATLLKWLQPQTVTEQNRQAPTWPQSCNNPAFDLPALKQRFGDDTPHLQRLLASFQRDLQQFGNDLAQSAVNHDRDSMIRQIHKIKGVAGNAGASAIYSEAVNIESRLKQQQPVDWSLLQNLISECLAQCKRHLAVLNEIAAEPTTISHTQLRQITQELRELLEFHHLVPSQLLSQLKNTVTDGVSAELLDKLIREVDAFNYDQAFATLARIQQELDQLSP